MKLPTFLIVGVQKAGTTSIYKYLQQHPQVYMSPIKETNFLEKDWEAFAAETGRQNRSGINTFAEYCHLFENATDELALGEISPNYLFHHETSAERIQRYVPHAKLIAILRNPIERAYSDYLMHVRDAIDEKSLSEQIKTSAHQSYIIRKGLYYTPLKYYFDKFGQEQLKVYLYEDLCTAPAQFMSALYRFIGVDDGFDIDTSKKAQVAQVPKVKLVNNLLQRQNPLRSSIAAVLKPLFPEEARQTLRQKLVQLNSQDKQKAPLSAEDRQGLIEIYREDILKLQDLIGRDLSTWLN
ncbi:MAG: sulfotransferase [Cyanophyceae cyanobacterium]